MSRHRSVLIGRLLSVRLLFVLIGIGGVGVSRQAYAQSASESQSKPVVAVMTDNEAFGVATRFVLYRDGLVLFRSDENSPYQAVKLNAKERAALLAQFSLSAFDLLEPRFDTGAEVGSGDDAPVWRVTHFGDKRRFDVSGRGHFEQGGKERDKAPREFLAILDQALSFAHKRAKKWVPTVLQGTLAYRDRQDEEKIPDGWPAALPKPARGAKTRTFWFKKALVPVVEEYRRRVNGGGRWHLGYAVVAPREQDWR